VILFGGSWGATLSLLFAIQYPKRVKAMVLRGIFLGDKRSLDYFENGDIGRIYPEAWERFESAFPKSQRHRKFEFLNEMVNSNDPETRRKFAFEYVLFGMSSTKKEYHLDALVQAVKNMDYESYTKVQLHYVVNRFFLEDNFILNNLGNLENIPIDIVHGRYDILCPLQYAFELHKKLLHSNLTIPDAGHAPTEPALERLMTEKLIKLSTLQVQK
jgi:proline iminopeptidase